MMQGGQPIDPGLIQALGNISSAPEEQKNLQQQMALAQQLRQPNNLGHTQMAGKVAIRNSPLNLIGQGLGDYAAGKRENDTMQQMRDLAANLRDTRGRYISAIAASQDPSQLHPDSQAALMQPTEEPGVMDAGGGDM
jgi:hypothetical protein